MPWSDQNARSRFVEEDEVRPVALPHGGGHVWSSGSASRGRFVGMRRETPADRLRLAMAMQREGTEMMRRNLRRKHPEASEAELDALLDEWLLSREPDAPGRCIAWPTRRARSARPTQ